MTFVSFIAQHTHMSGGDRHTHSSVWVSIPGKINTQNEPEPPR